MRGRIPVHALLKFRRPDIERDIRREIITVLKATIASDMIAKREESFLLVAFMKQLFASNTLMIASQFVRAGSTWIVQL